jgi:hypothetical protein
MAALSIYQDDACTSPVFQNFLIDSNAPPYCVALTPGVALKSKEITVDYVPGTCEPMTVQAGSVELLEPITYCCRDLWDGN